MSKKPPRVQHCHMCKEHHNILTPATLCMREPAYLETVPYGYCEACYKILCESRVMQFMEILEVANEIERIEQLLRDKGASDLEIIQIMNAAARGSEVRV